MEVIRGQWGEGVERGCLYRTGGKVLTRGICTNQTCFLRKTRGKRHRLSTTPACKEGELTNGLCCPTCAKGRQDTRELGDGAINNPPSSLEGFQRKMSIPKLRCCMGLNRAKKRKRGRRSKELFEGASEIDPRADEEDPSRETKLDKR